MNSSRYCPGSGVMTGADTASCPGSTVLRVILPRAVKTITRGALTNGPERRKPFLTISAAMRVTTCTLRLHCSTESGASQNKRPLSVHYGLTSILSTHGVSVLVVRQSLGKAHPDVIKAFGYSRPNVRGLVGQVKRTIGLPLRSVRTLRDGIRPSFYASRVD